jgi:hypothetical protein
VVTFHLHRPLIAALLPYELAPRRRYPAIGTFVRWCGALRCESCSGLLGCDGPVVEIFVRETRLATYDPTWPRQGGQTVLAGSVCLVASPLR